MMKTIICTLTVVSVLCLSSCLSKEEKLKKAEDEGNTVVAMKSKFIKGVGDALKKEGKEASESVSEGVGEVVKGTNSGLDKSLNTANVIPVDSVAFAKVLTIGRTEKFFSESEKTKRVSVYLISNKAYQGKVKLKAFDRNQKEIGRSVVDVSLKEDDAQYFDFKFDSRTPLLQAESFSIEAK